MGTDEKIIINGEEVSAETLAELSDGKGEE